MLVAYVDQHDVTRTPQVVPCRYAELERVTVHGTTVSLDLSLQEFAHAADLGAFGRDLGSLSAGRLPEWNVSGTNATIQGFYWLESSGTPGTVSRSDELESWEKIVAQVSTREDFRGERCYYTIREMREAVSNSALGYDDKGYHLEPDKQYELSIYHYHPSLTPSGLWLRLDSENRWVTNMSNLLLSIDSRYDQKRVRFRSGRPWQDEEARVSIYRIQDADPRETLGSPEFDLSLTIRSSRWPLYGYVLLLATLLATPQILQAWLETDYTQLTKIVVTVVALVFGLAVGIVGVFGLQRFP